MTFYEKLMVATGVIFSCSYSSNYQRLDIGESNNESTAMHAACRVASNINSPVYMDVGDIVSSIGVGAYDDAVSVSFALYYRVLPNSVISMCFSYGFIEDYGNSIFNVSLGIDIGDFI